MSCDKKECCSRPRELMLDPAALLNLGEKGARVVAQLLAVAKTGAVSMLDFPDATTQMLALEIIALWQRAQEEKKITPLVADIDSQNDAVFIAFGPGNQYRLTVPVAGPTAKKELAHSLRRVAAVLDPDMRDAQLPLPFNK